MRRRNSKIKKIIIITILFLIVGDVSLLFASQNSLNDALNHPTLLAQAELTGPAGFGPPQLAGPPGGPLPSPPPTAQNQAQGSPQQQAINQLLQQLGGPQAVAQATLPPSAQAPPSPQPVAQDQTPDQNQPGANPPSHFASTTDEVAEAAFDTMTKATLPMSPDQIQRLRKLFNDSQFAASAMPGTPPRPTAVSQYVNLEPGATPPVIRLSQGFVTSLVFIDATGAPWPIEAYDIGNPGAFNIQWNKSDNVLLIQAQSLYTYGNMAVRLRKLETPVMLTLIPGQKAVDYRVDLRIPKPGPEARIIPIEGTSSGTNLPLLNVLDGIPPQGSRALEIRGGEAEAWLLGDKLYLRTRCTVLSPGWIATMSSADGMKAYEMFKAPMILVSDHGRTLQLRVEGF